MFKRPLAVKRPLALLAAAALATGALAACDSSGSADGKLSVVAAAYPFEWLSRQIGGDQVKVTNLVKPGAEPHDLELTPKLVAAVSEAKLVVYLPGFQPAVDSAVSQHAVGRTFDVAGVEPLAESSAAEHDHDHGPGASPGIGEDKDKKAKDPHVWLDPVRFAKIGDQLAERFGQADPGHAAEYKSRAATVRAELEKLDKEYAEGLKTCQRKELVTSHAAFGYLTTRYKLEQISIAGLSPDQEPSAQKIAEIVAEAKEHGATIIFTEALVSPAIAKTIASEAGAKTEVLDPIESLPEGSSEDYAKIMRANLGKIRAALGCS
ncbi:metal ABC transporter substrate-binding protein [Longispora albida]|uniref:metal ABC transporter substrate-binding protein n=1 Tax=Longispora albida TaxID=203523 RepID=UPI0003792153|nr:metal ABC transporter substrate-binding protein [Longispora albida]